MRTAIYYYTGTGNSLWTARLLAGELGNADVYSISRLPENPDHAKADRVGFVFPVHIWGVPQAVLKFLQKMDKNIDTYYFALAVNAGQVSRTLIQLQEILRKRGLLLSAGYSIVLPSNYIPWGGPGPLEKQNQRFQETRARIKQIAGNIAHKRVTSVEMGPLWQRIIFTWIYKMTFNIVSKMDKDFWVDDRCNGCALCAKVCPAQNIRMQSGKPVWQHSCEQCLACIQWCPLEAIQYGKKTPGYERYHHPEIKIGDILAGIP